MYLSTKLRYIEKMPCSYLKHSTCLYPTGFASTGKSGKVYRKPKGEVRRCDKEDRLAETVRYNTVRLEDMPTTTCVIPSFRIVLTMICTRKCYSLNSPRGYTVPTDRWKFWECRSCNRRKATQLVKETAARLLVLHRKFAPHCLSLSDGRWWTLCECNTLR